MPFFGEAFIVDYLAYKYKLYNVDLRNFVSLGTDGRQFSSVVQTIFLRMWRSKYVNSRVTLRSRQLVIYLNIKLWFLNVCAQLHA